MQAMHPTVRRLRGAIAATLALGALLAGCQVEEEAAQVSVQADALIGPHQVTHMTLTVLPENVSTALTRNDSGAFAGAAVVPAGPHTFEVRAFVNAAQVGFGTATADVVPDAVTALQVTVLDTTGRDPGQPHSPLVLSFAASNAQPRVGDSVTLTADIVDPDGDPLTYAWTSTCAASQFDRTDAATVSWSASAPGACTLRLDATAGGHTVTRMVNLIVFSAASSEGAVDVSTTFVSNPFITGMHVFNRDNGGTILCEMSRYDGDWSCAGTATAGALHGVTIDGVGSLTIADNCGGQVSYFFGGPRWRAPATPAVCLLTATLTNVYGLTDSMSLAFVVK